MKDPNTFGQNTGSNNATEGTAEGAKSAAPNEVKVHPRGSLQYCSGCGHQNALGAQKCTNCQAELSAPPAKTATLVGEEVSKPAAPTKPNMISCPKCGKENGNTYRHCLGCGCQLLQATGSTRVKTPSTPAPAASAAPIPSMPRMPSIPPLPPRPWTAGGPFSQRPSHPGAAPTPFARPASAAVSVPMPPASPIESGWECPQCQTKNPSQRFCKTCGHDIQTGLGAGAGTRLAAAAAVTTKLEVEEEPVVTDNLSSSTVASTIVGAPARPPAEVTGMESGHLYMPGCHADLQFPVSVGTNERGWVVEWRPFPKIGENVSLFPSDSAPVLGELRGTRCQNADGEWLVYIGLKVSVGLPKDSRVGVVLLGGTVPTPASVFQVFDDGVIEFLVRPGREVSLNYRTASYASVIRTMELAPGNEPYFVLGVSGGGSAPPKPPVVAATVFTDKPARPPIEVQRSPSFSLRGYPYSVAEVRERGEDAVLLLTPVPSSIGQRVDVQDGPEVLPPVFRGVVREFRLKIGDRFPTFFTVLTPLASQRKEDRIPRGKNVTMHAPDDGGRIIMGGMLEEYEADGVTAVLVTRFDPFVKGEPALVDLQDGQPVRSLLVADVQMEMVMGVPHLVVTFVKNVVAPTIAVPPPPLKFVPPTGLPGQVGPKVVCRNPDCKTDGKPTPQKDPDDVRCRKCGTEYKDPTRTIPWSEIKDQRASPSPPFPRQALPKVVCRNPDCKTDGKPTPQKDPDDVRCRKCGTKY